MLSPRRACGETISLHCQISGGIATDTYISCKGIGDIFEARPDGKKRDSTLPIPSVIEEETMCRGVDGTKGDYALNIFYFYSRA